MSSLSFKAAGAARNAIAAHIGALVADKVASRVAAKDPTLWGPAAESEASIRLDWVDLAATSRPLVDEITALRGRFKADGVTHYVLAGMGGSSLAPEVITAAAGMELTVLDSTDPDQVRTALADRPERTALVVSSKSGTTLETDSALRAFSRAFTDAGIDAASRIVIVTDPGSPLEAAGREAGYRAVFTADPNVGGRYSALTAFGLVPSGLAGVDIAGLLDEAEEAAEILAEDAPDNIGLALGCALGGTSPLRNKIVIVDDGSGIPEFGNWAEQLIAESTGKLGTGVLPVVVEPGAPELSSGADDVLIVRLTNPNADDEHAGDEQAGNWSGTKGPGTGHQGGRDSGSVTVSGSLGSQLMLWEYAVVVAGRLLGINPFDQPDVEAAKKAARGLLEDRPEPAPANFVDGAIEIRGGGWLGSARTAADAVAALLAELGPEGYLSVQAYLDRTGHPELAQIRSELAAVTGRPVTFGWGPRFLHSTGQFHKGGPAIGVYLQITAAAGQDLPIPDQPFSFGQLIEAQAAGDAGVLAGHGRPVLALHLTDRDRGLTQLRALISGLNGSGPTPSGGN